MLEEEWRLHANLFGGRRFAAFPAVVFAVAGGAFGLLYVTGTSGDTIAAGMHAVVAFFGLQVGTIGLVGRDAMRDVLGDVTLLVFSSRTLPVSLRRLLATFLAKDLLYYSALFLAPIAVAYTPLALATGATPTRAALLWVTLSGVFALGVGLSLTLVGLAGRSRVLTLGSIALVTAGVVGTGVDPVSLTPYGLYVDPTPASAVRGFTPALAVAVVGVTTFEPVERTGGRQRRGPLTSLADAIPDSTGIARRTLLSIFRSSGSIWKVIFSMGVLFVVASVLFSELARATALDPHVGIAFGVLLGMGGFTTYAWLTQFEDAREMLRYPITTEQVLASKRWAYLVLVFPIGLGYIAVATLWFPVKELAVAVVVFPPVAVYVFGLSAYVAGLSPSELLFDTPLFLAFGIGLAVVSVPLLVAAFAYAAAPTRMLALAIAISVFSAGVGVALGRRAGPRWHRKLRA